MTVSFLLRLLIILYLAQPWDRDRANPQLAIFLERHIFGTFDIYITGHNHVLADEGDHKKTRQLISATGALPGGSPIETEPGKFNVELPGYLKIIVEGNSARYEFIGAEKEKFFGQI